MGEQENRGPRDSSPLRPNEGQHKGRNAKDRDRGSGGIDGRERGNHIGGQSQGEGGKAQDNLEEGGSRMGQEEGVAHCEPCGGEEGRGKGFATRGCGSGTG